MATSGRLWYECVVVQIEIEIPRPILLLALCAGIGGFLLWSSGEGQEASVGGGEPTWQQEVQHAESGVERQRMRQEILERREEILRTHIERLQEGSHLDPSMDDKRSEELREAMAMLSQLLQDRREADRWLIASMDQLWEAQDRAKLFADVRPTDEEDPHLLLWPVEPIEGISAYFHDEEYLRLIGLRHDAIDIPRLQGTPIIASADGTVVDVSDKGKGFSSLTIRFDNGLTALYGHVSKFHVSEGRRVEAGDLIAETGGQPGTDGAGFITTGQHLHFELYFKGEAVDPLDFLPPL